MCIFFSLGPSNISKQRFFRANTGNIFRSLLTGWPGRSGFPITRRLSLCPPLHTFSCGSLSVWIYAEKSALRWLRFGSSPALSGLHVLISICCRSLELAVVFRSSFLSHAFSFCVWLVHHIRLGRTEPFALSHTSCISCQSLSPLSYTNLSSALTTTAACSRFRFRFVDHSPVFPLSLARSRNLLPLSSGTHPPHIHTSLLTAPLTELKASLSFFPRSHTTSSLLPDTSDFRMFQNAVQAREKAVAAC